MSGPTRAKTRYLDAAGLLLRVFASKNPVKKLYARFSTPPTINILAAISIIHPLFVLAFEVRRRQRPSEETPSQSTPPARAGRGQPILSCCLCASEGRAEAPAWIGENHEHRLSARQGLGIQHLDALALRGRSQPVNNTEFGGTPAEDNHDAGHGDQHQIADQGRPACRDPARSARFASPATSKMATSKTRAAKSALSIRLALRALPTMFPGAHCFQACPCWDESSTTHMQHPCRCAPLASGGFAKAERRPRYSELRWSPDASRKVRLWLEAEDD